MKRVSLFCFFCVTVLCASFAQPVKAFADKPAFVTAVGQSADFEMVKVLLTRNKIPFKADTLVKAEDLTQESKTLILVVGGSSKGLGAAGISADVEGARAKAVIARAKKLKMKIITVQVGGAARRGVLSDKFIEICMAGSDYAIIVEDADQDGFFTRLAGEAKIALTKVGRISAAGAPLAAAFK